MYSNMRLELNKLMSVNHPNITQFLGLCVISFSFLLEWAPMGSLKEIIQMYKLAESAVCPDTVATTVLQVNITTACTIFVLCIHTTIAVGTYLAISALKFYSTTCYIYTVQIL